MEFEGRHIVWFESQWIQKFINSWIRRNHGGYGVKVNNAGTDQQLYIPMPPSEFGPANKPTEDCKCHSSAKNQKH